MPAQRDPEGFEVQHLHDLADFSGAHVLEIGCGEGRLTWRYADFASSVTAIDPDRTRLATALEDHPQSISTPVSFMQAQAQKLPFRDTTFDRAILAWSL